jgi:hypothetical protein
MIALRKHHPNRKHRKGLKPPKKLKPLKPHPTSRNRLSAIIEPAPAASHFDRRTAPISPIQARAGYAKRARDRP